MPNRPESERSLWIRGDTYRYRQQIRDLSGYWDREASVWRLPWSQRSAAAISVAAWSGCTLHCPVPVLPQGLPEAAFVRLLLRKRPLALNDCQDLAQVGNWYDVTEANDLLLCYVLREGKRESAFFLCLAEVLETHFESQV